MIYEKTWNILQHKSWPFSCFISVKLFELSNDWLIISDENKIQNLSKIYKKNFSFEISHKKNGKIQEFQTKGFWQLFDVDILIIVILFEYFPLQGLGVHLPNFRFWSKFQFFTIIAIFDQNFSFWPKFRFLNKISVFDQNFDFWTTFRFLNEIAIFEHNFDFRTKFHFFLTKISIF